ncbi:MAG: DEAD/DEAH box helicase [Propionibacteriaceae bacterium]|jgi:superfamily II DNA or RNA helicase|nr:DEAD/DEAH box helicase [Propionibacteriaceae bacterium]
MTETVHFQFGSLVTARGRDWVVDPGSDNSFLLLRPLAGGDLDVAGVYPEFEEVRPATFPLPTPDDRGDFHSARLLRDALRIGFRSSGGPFRSLASLAVDPRPYQYVPLLMALRQRVTRLLIADDVGVGKTIEAGLVASELLAQGSAEGMTVICPPSLAEQWQEELHEKFMIDAELVLPSTVARLQRGLGTGDSIFEHYRNTIVSTDFIKSDQRRPEFLRSAPDLIIVDEAHTCVVGDRGTSGRSAVTQRYELLTEIAKRPEKHLILVTATPHSGHESAFRNLLGLLDPALTDVDLSTEGGRRHLARHLVQRRRGDIRSYLGHDTRFPSDRVMKEVSYRLTEPYAALVRQATAYARGQVTDTSGTKVQQRIRWWSALAMLRSISSSPAAAAATLRARAVVAEADNPDVADQLGREALFDVTDDTNPEGEDAAPGAIPTASPRPHGVLAELAQAAEALTPGDDAKLTQLVHEVSDLLKHGFSPIVFCRFIPTAHYVRDHLRSVLRLPIDAIDVVTGELSPQDRAERVTALVDRSGGTSGRVLVATDCLSEGVNLQEGFQAVVHYDLAWNPTRHEQREGRVDRFGQRSETVRAVTLYGEDNGIDNIVMDVLIRKHTQIRRDLGVSVPVPNEANNKVLDALVTGVMTRGMESIQPTLGDEFGDLFAVADGWRSAAEAERESRTRYAQAAIHPEEVAREVAAAREQVGTPSDIAHFVRASLELIGGVAAADDNGLTVDTSLLPPGLRDGLLAHHPRITGAAHQRLRWVTDLPAPHGSATMTRSDPHVVALARFVLDGSLDPTAPETQRPARRTGVVTTTHVERVTTLLLLRHRMRLVLPTPQGFHEQIAEEAEAVAFTGTPASPRWLSRDEVTQLLSTRPSANTPADRATNMITAVLGALPTMADALAERSAEAAETARESHVRVRRAARGGETAGSLTIRGIDVEPLLPTDVLGVYVFLPDALATPAMGGAR